MRALASRSIYVYDIGMRDEPTTRLLRSQPVSNEQIQAWADEAEAGYDVAALEARSGTGRGRGRPSVGAGPGTVVAVRLDAATVEALTQRARAEGITTRSEALRAAVAAWAPVKAG